MKKKNEKILICFVCLFVNKNILNISKYKINYEKKKDDVN